MLSGLSLHLLHGSPVLAGALTAKEAHSLQSRGVELLSASSVSPSDIEPALPAKPAAQSAAAQLRVVYLKDYTAEEMVARGAAGFHAGWSLSAFIAEWPALLARDALASPLGEAVQAAGLIDARARAALAALPGDGAAASL